MEESSTSMNVASVTVRAMIHGLKRGFHAEGAWVAASTMLECDLCDECYFLELFSERTETFTSGVTDMPGRSRPSWLKSGLSLLSKSMRTGMRCTTLT